jgi:hypothetical protein
MKENRGEITMKEDKHRLCARVVAGVSWLAKLRLRKGPVAADSGEARRCVHNRYCPKHNSVLSNPPD